MSGESVVHQLLQQLGCHEEKEDGYDNGEKKREEEEEKKEKKKERRKKKKRGEEEEACLVDRDEVVLDGVLIHLPKVLCKDVRSSVQELNHHQGGTAHAAMIKLINEEREPEREEEKRGKEGKEEKRKEEGNLLR